ncbi:MAG: AAA family ATPase [Thiotrichaceae bacterium]
MIFKVENLGIIQHAEIDLSKDLILFCGHNNTGKTYLAYAIYYLLIANLDGSLFAPSFALADVPSKYQDKKLKSVDLIDFFNSFDNLEAVFREQLSRYMNELRRFLGSSEQSKPTKFDIIISEEERNNKLMAMDFIIHSGNPQRQEWRKSSNSPNVFFENENIIDLGYVNFFLVPRIIRSRVMMFPAERSATIVFSKELSLNKTEFFEKLLITDEQTIDMSDLFDLARQRVNRYARPIRDNLKIAEDLTNLAKNSSGFNSLAEELEKQILGGKIHVSQYGNLTYSPDHTSDVALGMELSSSTVGSLSSLVFYLRHLAQKGDTLILDEPELSLHPDNQRIIARFFGSLVNAGFKLIISTHSDYIVREINNLIMLSKKSRKTAGLRKKYGYTKEQVLQPQQVGAYLFKRGEPGPKSIEVSETGLEISTIDEVVADLNQSSQNIYFCLFD